MKNRKKVSIITPMFNDEKYIGYFLDSICHQTYDNIELILVDDGSTDSSASLLKAQEKLLSEKGISFKYLYQEHAGQAAAINRMLPLFSGDYLKWMDSDDMLDPTCIEKQVRFLEENPQYGFCVCDEKHVQYAENGEFEFLHFFGRKCDGENDRLFLDMLDFKKPFSYGSGTILVRRECLRKAIPSMQIYESEVGQNYQLMLPLAYYERCGYLHEPLFIRVTIPDSHSHRERTYKEASERLAKTSLLKTETIKRMNLPEEPRLLEMINTRELIQQLEMAKTYGEKKEVWKITRQIRRKKLIYRACLFYRRFFRKSTNDTTS